MSKIISIYSKEWQAVHGDREQQHGAYFYSKEIVDNIIPRINTDRNWLTINHPIRRANHSIVFVHSNLFPGKYDWLRPFKDVIYVCSLPETCEKMASRGKTIFLPLSVNVAEVEQYKREKTKDVCFAGRSVKKTLSEFDLSGVDDLSGLTRSAFLSRLAEYRRAYCVGRVAIEAKILGVEVLPYDKRFPDPERWEILDNKDAADLLRIALERIDGDEEKEG